MPLQATSGAASYDAFGGGVAVIPNYIESCFSTYLYTGNGSTQTITNGIDLAGKGGLVWTKDRSSALNHNLVNTISGNTKYLNSNNTVAEQTTSPADNITAFNANGYSLGADTATNQVNYSGEKYASWTFREQPKFFDVVTYTGNGTAGRTVAHNLGSVPGCILIKATDSAQNWFVYHRSLNNDYTLILNSTSAKINSAVFNFTDPTSTNFTLGTSSGVNGSGISYVAYVFAHNAGGFGLSGTDNVISCGSYNGTGAANNSINLGYEAQWVLIKNTTSAGNGWILVDNMRGGLSETTYAYLQPNTSGAEVAGGGASLVCATATGFRVDATGGAFNASGDTYIYIAIRRGPMKVPTTGTSVFNALTRTGTDATAQVTGVGFAPDLVNVLKRQGTTRLFSDRLRGRSVSLLSTNTAAETTSVNAGNDIVSYNMDGITLGPNWNIDVNSASEPYVNYFFRRAPGFFDEVCYTGTGTAGTKTHNLGVAPELMIVANRNPGGEFWPIYAAPLGNTTECFMQSASAAQSTSGGGDEAWNSTTPTSSVFSVSNDNRVNASGQTYVAYLFATCPGVSKVGSYTGTGTTQTINCGFTAGSRFVLIKRTDASGGWHVWDSARGIVAGNDPYLLLNSTAAEVTNTDFVDTAATGFEISSTAPAAINASGGTFIFLAIA